MPKFHNLNPPNNNGETPLHCAVKNGHFDTCKYIIDNVEEKNPMDSIGFTPLHYAAVAGHLDIFKFIIQNVDDKNPEDVRGITPLHCSVHENREDISKFITENVIKKETKIMLNINAKIKISKATLSTLKSQLDFQHYKKAKIEQQILKSLKSDT